MTPTPTPDVALTYANMADLFVPIYFFLSLVLTVAICYVAYAIVIKPWLRG